MFIYSITNLVNQKIYIGQTVNPTNRFAYHKNYLRNNKHDNPHLQNAWNKYGEQSFSFNIVECIIVNDVDYLNEREQYWIDNTKASYNIIKNVVIGLYPKCNLKNGFKGKTHSAKTKKILSAAASKRVGNLNSFYNKNHSQNTINTLSIKAKERLADPKNHPMYKDTIYKFVHKKTKQELTMTQYDFLNHLNNQTGYASRGNVSSLINGKIKSYKGFIML